MFKRDIGWTIVDILKILPEFVLIRLSLNESALPSVEHHYHLNLSIQEVIKREIIKWFDMGMDYPISHIKWVILVQCMPKKGGITTVPNGNNELVPMK